MNHKSGNSGRKFSPQHAHHLLSQERRRSLNLDAALQEVGLSEGMVVADLGCGNGFFTLPLAEKVGEEGKVYAVDISPKMLELLRQRDLPPQVEVVLSEENKIPVPTDEVDFAVASNLFHELDDRYRFLLEVRRILKEKGRLWIIDWIPKEEPQGPPLDHRLPAVVVHRDLVRAGFEVLWQKTVGPSHYQILAVKQNLRCGC